MAGEQAKKSVVAGTRDFLEECYDEMHKVTWPDWPQTRNATWVIIIFVILVSAVIWTMDKISGGAIGMIMSLFGAG